ncbi:MAG: replicative DNA helicase [Treponema sp.]|nr:replicative DNA helicase [Treponema sp.]
MATDKTLPHDDDIERAALGILLFDSGKVNVAKHNRLKADDFYTKAHYWIYQAISNLDDKSLCSDIQTVVQELKGMGKLDDAGGAAYVSSLTTVIPSGANIEYYIRSVLDHSLRRALLRVGLRIGTDAYDESREAPQILEEVERGVFELRGERQLFRYDRIGSVLGETIDKIERAYRLKNPLTGLSTGIPELDRMTTGFQPSDLIIIGARPSVGKTALALNMAANMAFKEQRPTAFFSLEMPSTSLVERIVSSKALINGEKMRNGSLSPDDFKKIVDAMGKMNDAPFFIVDAPNMKLLDLRSQARQLRAKENVEVIFIDYLGLIGHENNKLPLHQQISEISRSLKGLARELKIPIVVLCQLNRETERSGHNQPPNLANIRDSGSIEQDADLVMFLHRKSLEKEKKDGEEQPAPDGKPTELIVAKQRNGPVGHIDLVFQSKYTRFVPLDKPYQG